MWDDQILALDMFLQGMNVQSLESSGKSSIANTKEAIPAIGCWDEYYVHKDME